MSEANPLLQGFAPGAPVGWRAGRPLAIGSFLGAAAALARRLPRGGHCINACEDRLHFLTGFAAALMAETVTLLPQSRAANAVSELSASYGGAGTLTDADVATAQPDQDMAHPNQETAQPPSIPRGQVAVILFTFRHHRHATAAHKDLGRPGGGARVPCVRACRKSPVHPLSARCRAQHMWGLGNHRDAAAAERQRGGCVLPAAAGRNRGGARRRAGAALAGGDAGASAGVHAVWPGAARRWRACSARPRRCPRIPRGAPKSSAARR